MNRVTGTRKKTSASVWLYAGFVVLTSFFTYMYRYQNPPSPFWDEPYHIVSAQKYLNGIYFMEQHPPLGKLLIALGEKIVHANEKNDQFITTDYATNIQKDFSFAGYRLVPAMLAWLTAPLLFFIFLFITGSSPLSALLSFVYIFDNAEIVHSRGAMVDSPATFFGMVAILAFLHIKKPSAKQNTLGLSLLSALFGLSFGLAVTTKLVSLIFALLIPFTIWKLLDTLRERKIFFGVAFLAAVVAPLFYYCVFTLLFWLGTKTQIIAFFNLTIALQNPVLLSTLGILVTAIAWRKLWVMVPASHIVFRFLLIGFFSFLVAFVAVWQIHFSLGKRVLPELNTNGFYLASPEYKKILASGMMNSPWSFPVMIRDSMNYVPYFSKGVPRLDLCKPDENGSPAFLWPFGARTINYRWEQAGEGVYRYLYLQSNPVAWFCGLLGVILSIILLSSTVLFESKEKLKQPYLLTTFLALYLSYMIAISQITRVMYLYHYFLPLLFSFILFGLAINNLQRLGSWALTEERRIIVMTVIGLLIFAAFQFYRPLSYYEPISDNAFKKRAVLQTWELTCVRCQKFSPIAVPVSSK